jgi:hypothetical protein
MISSSSLLVRADRFEVMGRTWTVWTLIGLAAISLGASRDGGQAYGLNLQWLPWYGELIVVMAWGAVMLMLMRRALPVVLSFAAQRSNAPDRFLNAHTGYWWVYFAVVAVECGYNVATSMFDFEQGTPFWVWLFVVLANGWSVLSVVGVYAWLTDRCWLSPRVWRIVGACYWFLLVLVIALASLLALGLGHSRGPEQFDFLLTHVPSMILFGAALYAYAFSMEARGYDE